MRSLVVGDNGLIETKLVTTVTTEGPADALEGPSAVVDVSNSSPFEHAAVLEFFEMSVAYFGDVEHSFRLVPNARVRVDR